jgi:hypothetical protein
MIKLKFKWKEIQQGIYLCKTMHWDRGCLVWDRCNRMYVFHRSDISAPPVGAWLMLGMAQTAIENMLQQEISGESK